MKQVQLGIILLISCMKRLDGSIYQKLIAPGNGEFHGGQTFPSDLEYIGVGLASYHDFETLIPDRIKPLFGN